MEERWDLVQSAADRDDASWLEDAAGEALGDSDSSERFLQGVLPRATKISRDFRDGLSRLISQHQDANIKDISRALGYLVLWPPGSAIRIGDIGTFPSGIPFVMQTQISALDVGGPPLTDVVTGAAEDLTYLASDVSIAADGSAVRIDFAKAGATYFMATGARVRRIGDLSQLARQVLVLVKAGKWHEDWNVVTEVVEADLVLFFVAGEDDAFVEFIGPPSAGPASAGQTPGIVRQQGMQLTYIAGPGALPLFRAVKVSKSRSVKISPVHAFT